MRKILFIIVFVSGTLFAQEEASNLDKSTYNKILIGLSVSPDYAYRTLSTTSKANEFTEDIIILRDKIEAGKLLYTFGLSFNYNFSQNFGLITGVLYSAKGC